MAWDETEKGNHAVQIRDAVVWPQLNWCASFFQ